MQELNAELYNHCRSLEEKEEERVGIDATETLEHMIEEAESKEEKEES